MKRGTRKLVVGMVLGLAVAGGWIWWVKGGVRSPEVVLGGQSPTTQASDFPAGTELTYDLELATEQQLAGPDGTGGIQAKMGLAGKVSVRSYGVHDGRLRLGITLIELDDARVEFGPDTILDASRRSEVVGRQSVLEINPDGRLAAVYHAKDATAAQKAVMDAVAPYLFVSRPHDGAAMWTADDPTMFGVAKSFYSADGETIRRNRGEYLALKAFSMDKAPGPVELHGEDRTEMQGGQLRTLTSDETIAVTLAGQPRFRASARVRIGLQDRGSFVASSDPLAQGSWQRTGVSQIASSADAARALAQGVVGDFTLTDLERGLSLHGITNMRLPEGWMTRAVVLLQLNPAYARRLADLFDAPGQTLRGRQFICDILASAGTPEAQAAMQDALSSPAAHGDPTAFGGLLQRFSFVERPTAQTMSFLSEQMRAGGSAEDRLAAAYALGAAVGHDAKQGGAGRQYAEALVQALRNANTPEDRKAMIAALGNAALPEHLEVLQSYTSDPDPDVRRALGRAVRKNDLPESRRVLLDLAKDGDASVAKTAINTLRTQTMGRDDLEQLESVYSSVAFDHGSLDGEVVSVLEIRSEDDPVRERMLASILTSTRDAQLAARVRMIATKPESAM